MEYYAKISENNVVEQIVVASPDIILTYEGIWIETFVDDPNKKYAGIGDGYDGANFTSQPFLKSTWNGNSWTTPSELGIVGNASPIITADGVDFVTVYLISMPITQETVTINGETTLITTDNLGYAEFELSSDTQGLITVSWSGLVLEVAAI